MTGIASGLAPMAAIRVQARGDDGRVVAFTATARIDTPEELGAFKAGGILPYVLRQFVEAGPA